LLPVEQIGLKTQENIPLTAAGIRSKGKKEIYTATIVDTAVKDFKDFKDFKLVTLKFSYINNLYLYM